MFFKGSRHFRDCRGRFQPRRQLSKRQKLAASEQEAEASEGVTTEEGSAIEVVANREVVAEGAIAAEEGPAIGGAVQESAAERLPDGAGERTKTTRATLKDKAS